MKLNKKTTTRTGYVSWHLTRRGSLIILHWSPEQYSNRKAVAEQIRKARARLSKR